MWSKVNSINFVLAVFAAPESMSYMTWNVEFSPDFQIGTWENRIVRRRIERAGGHIYIYGICEVMYTAAGKIFMCTDPIEMAGENPVWLRDRWMDALEAFRKPILDYDADINTPEAHQEREAMLQREEAEIEEFEEGTSADEMFEKMGLTKDQFLEKIGVEDGDDDTFDPVEYCRSQMVECDNQEREFEKFHGKRLREIFDQMIHDRIEEEKE